MSEYDELYEQYTEENNEPLAEEENTEAADNVEESADTVYESAQVQTEPIEDNTEKKYFKESFLRSKQYKAYIDILNVVLEDDEFYTKGEVNEILNNRLNKEVE